MSERIQVSTFPTARRNHFKTLEGSFSAVHRHRFLHVNTPRRKEAIRPLTPGPSRAAAQATESYSDFYPQPQAYSPASSQAPYSPGGPGENRRTRSRMFLAELSYLRTTMTKRAEPLSKLFACKLPSLTRITRNFSYGYSGCYL